MPHSCRIPLGLKVVGLFTVLRDVQSLNFVFFRYAHARQQIYDLQQHYRPDKRKSQAISAHELIANLSPVTVKPAHRFARAKNRIDYLLRKNSREQRSNRSACSVHAEGIKRVIIPEDGLHFRHHPMAASAGDESDYQRGHRRDKSRRRRNGHESCHRSGDCT